MHTHKLIEANSFWLLEFFFKFVVLFLFSWFQATATRPSAHCLSAVTQGRLHTFESRLSSPVLHFIWMHLSSALEIFTLWVNESPSFTPFTLTMHKINQRRYWWKTRSRHREPPELHTTLGCQPAHNCSSISSKVCLPWQSREADLFSGLQCCWSLLGNSDPREAAVQCVLSSEQPHVSCSAAMKPLRRVLSNLRAQSYCACHALMAAWLTTVEIIQWVIGCSDLFDAWVCARVCATIVRWERWIVFTSKIQTY